MMVVFFLNSLGHGCSVRILTHFSSVVLLICAIKIESYTITTNTIIGKEGNYKKLKLKPKNIIEIEIPN
jgi:hypothetical protein